MKTLKFILITCSLALALGLNSCKAKVVCAAYHSQFLLFPEVQDKYFSLFEKTDSVFTPKTTLTSSSKLWNGIAIGPNSKRTFNKRHYIIPTQDVYREIEETDSTGGTSMINLDSTKNEKKFSN
jgi:hypothetical protein